MINPAARIAQRKMHKAAVRACCELLGHLRRHPGGGISPCMAEHLKTFEKARREWMDTPAKL